MAENCPVCFADSLLVRSNFVRADGPWPGKYRTETSLACYTAMT